MAGGHPLDLACSVCDRRYAAEAWQWRCDCGAPLEFATEPWDRSDADLGDEPLASRLDTTAGLWGFAPLLPTAPHVSLGEGFTPLVDAPAWDAEFKLEYVSPTGSFKDRGATTTLSVAAELDVDRVVEDSSGNAGAAIATYAARAGADADIYVPASVKPGKLRAIERAGATAVPIEGSRAAVTDACVDAVETGDAWYASHAWNPAFFAGTATFAYEVCAQRGWTAPDAVVLPVGHGTLFLGAYRGFRTLRELGWIGSVPRLLGAQAAGSAPIVAAVRDEAAAAGDNEVADGIQIREPVRMSQIVDAVAATDGDAIAFSETMVENALDALHRRGFYTEPTCAIAPAALSEYRDRGLLASDADVVVPLTGSGLKS